MKSILVTGASSGFGLNVSVALAELGWLVFASCRKPGRADRLREEVAARKLKERVVLLTLDVTDEESIARAVADMLARTGGSLDALLNNAGYSNLGAFEDMSDSDCRKQMDTNFFGALSVTRAVLPVMRRAGRGRIVIVSSNSVNTPHPMLSIYAASKWALEGWGEALAMEMAPFGVEVVVVQPGAHRTPFAEHVVSITPKESAYAAWMAEAMPGIADLDAWGRDPTEATAPIVAAVTEPNPLFRRAIGDDTVAFSMLKGLFPFELRAWAIRALVGLPAANAFKDHPVDPRAGVEAKILAKLAAALSRGGNGDVLSALLAGRKM